MAVRMNGINGADQSLAGSVSTSGIPALQTAASPAGATGAGTSTVSSVELTSRATRLAELEKTLVASSPVSDLRVQAASQALAAGTYKVDPTRIASGLIQSDQLLDPQPGDES